MISIVQRSPRMSIARATEQNSGRSSSYMKSNGSGSSAEGGKLSGQAYGVVVGHQEAGPLEHAQLRVGQQVERLLGGGRGPRAGAAPARAGRASRSASARACWA